MTTKPYTLHRGDCIAVMRGMADNSVDAVVTDPPYELGFMGKSWDASGIAYNVEVWREALRVLKPGGHLLAFSGSRTYHRMTCAIEDAGFEIRDSIAWLYGSGFPKSLDVSKAIDKAGGVSPRVQAELLKAKRATAGLSRDQVAAHVGCTAASVRDWEEGRARSTGASLEWITPSEQYRSALADLLGYSADERVVAGVAIDRAGDETVIGLGHSGVLRTGGHTDAARQWEGWGTALKPAHEPICVARKPLIGTVAANVLAHGTGALNIDGCRVAFETTTNAATNPLYRAQQGYAGTGSDSGSSSFKMKPEGAMASAHTAGRWPANLIHDGSAEVVALFPAQAGGGDKRGHGGGSRDGGFVDTGAGNGDGKPGGALYADTGSAARFFYCAKASRADRNAGLIDPGHQFEHGATLRKIEDAIALNATSYELKSDVPDWVKESVERFLSQSI